MSDLLEEAKKVLTDLENELKKGKTIWESILSELPPKSSWIEKQAKCWIHGATDVREASEIERWLFDYPPLSETAKSNAKNHVKCWREWLEIKDAYYEPFDDFEFEEPKKEESLIEFIHRISVLVEDEGPLTGFEWRAFKSFLAYLRQISIEEVAFIEQIFPRKMEIHHGRIIRIIAPEVPSIPQKIAAEILMELAQSCRFGRRNAQLTAAESLGLCWLCLTASRLRLPIHLEILQAIKTTALKLDGSFPTLLVPTAFGDRPIRISYRVAKFLQILSLIPSKKPRETILQRPLRSLTRTFEHTLKNVSPNPDFGNITYVSLLSPPHQFGSYRHQPK